jgi:hypothetical protein
MSAARIQKISISDLNQHLLRVEMAISDHPDLEKATVKLIATLPVKRRGHSLESIEAATIDAVVDLLRQAIPTEVSRRLKAVY